MKCQNEIYHTVLPGKVRCYCAAVVTLNAGTPWKISLCADCNNGAEKLMQRAIKKWSEKKMNLLLGTLSKGKVDKPDRTCTNCGAEYDDWTGEKPCPVCKVPPQGKRPPVDKSKHGAAS